MTTDAAGRFTFNNLPRFNRAVAHKKLAEKSQGALSAARDMSKAYPAVLDPVDDTATSNLIVTHPNYAVTTVNGGDVPGTVDVVMQPAAAIEGRVVEFGTGEPAAGILIQAVGAPMPVDEEVVGSVGGSGSKDVIFFNDVHRAATRTDASGHYRLANLPAGKYDVWPEAASSDARTSDWLAQGVKGIKAKTGASEFAPDIVLGPGGLVRGQLIDAAAKKPLAAAANGASLKATTLYDDPSMQQIPLQQVPVSHNGMFQIHVPPGKVRIYLIVQLSADAAGPKESYRSSDQTFRSGPMIDLKHGESIAAEFPVWRQAELEAQRSRVQRGFEKLREQRYDEAIAAFSEAIAHNPNDASALRCGPRRMSVRGSCRRQLPTTRELSK